MPCLEAEPSPAFKNRASVLPPNLKPHIPLKINSSIIVGMDDHPIIRASLVTAGLNLNANGGFYRPGVGSSWCWWQELRGGENYFVVVMNLIGQLQRQLQ